MTLSPTMDHSLVRRALSYFPGRPRVQPEVPVHLPQRIDEHLIRRIERFICETVDPGLGSPYRRVVVGLSGGLDSTTAAVLCRRALGPAGVTAVIVDLGVRGHATQARRAAAVAEELGIPFRLLRNRGLVGSLLEASPHQGPFSRVNAVTRAIHSLIFQYADARTDAVVSCVDRSEYLLSRHMEYFYGHIAPLQPLYKTEVARLADQIGVPRRVIEQPAGCVDAWLDEAVLGTSYDRLDPILFLIEERKWSALPIARKFGVDRRWLERVIARMNHREWRMVTRIPAV